MNENNYAILLIALEILFSLIVLLKLKKAGASNRVLISISLVWAVWLTSIYHALSSSMFGATAMPQVTFTLAIVLPVVMGYLALRYCKSLQNAVEKMTTKDFLHLQYFRSVFGVMFFFTATLPVWFQYIGGVGDILAGIGACFALYFFNKERIDERLAILYGNLVGILDFIVVLTLGLFVVLKDHSPDMMFNLIPLYVVPIFILLHIFSLERLFKFSDKARKQL
jgi:hypothetical protein